MHTVPNSALSLKNLWESPLLYTPDKKLVLEFQEVQKL
jgi:hypothetical protein